MFQVSLESDEIATKEENFRCQRCQMQQREQEKPKRHAVDFETTGGAN